MCVSEDLFAVRDGQGGTPAPACGGIEGLEGRDRWDMLVAQGRWLIVGVYSLPIVSTRPVNMV